MDQEKIMQFQMMEQQLSSLSQNLQTLEQNSEEINKIIQTLDEFKTLKKGDKILVPISSGIFAEATLDNAEHLKVNVGMNTVVKKDIEGTKNLMKEQLKDLETYKLESEKYYNELYLKLQELQAEYVREMQSKKQ